MLGDIFQGPELRSVVICGNSFINCKPLAVGGFTINDMTQCFGDNNHCLTEGTLPLCQCGKRGMLPDGVIVDI